MSFISKLIVDGKEHSLLSCEYEFEQPLDPTGKPSGKPVGGQLHLVVEADGSSDLLHWMVHPTQLKDGSLTFYKRDVMARMQGIEFQDGICCDYIEEYEAIDDSPLHIQLTIAVKSMQIDDVPYESNWAG